MPSSAGTDSALKVRDSSENYSELNSEAEDSISEETIRKEYVVETMTFTGGGFSPDYISPSLPVSSETMSE